MDISDPQLEKFIEIYQEQFGVKLSNEEALDKAISLLTFVKSSLKISNKSDNNE